jgi:hypothetical protein
MAYAAKADLLFTLQDYDGLGFRVFDGRFNYVKHLLQGIDFFPHHSILVDAQGQHLWIHFRDQLVLFDVDSDVPRASFHLPIDIRRGRDRLLLDEARGWILVNHVESGTLGVLDAYSLSHSLSCQSIRRQALPGLVRTSHPPSELDLSALTSYGTQSRVSNVPRPFSTGCASMAAAERYNSTSSGAGRSFRCTHRLSRRT